MRNAAQLPEFKAPGSGTRKRRGEKRRRRERKGEKNGGQERGEKGLITARERGETSWEKAGRGQHEEEHKRGQEQ